MRNKAISIISIWAFLGMDLAWAGGFDALAPESGLTEEEREVEVNVQTIFNWTTVQEAIPPDYTLLWVFGTDSLLVARKAAEQWHRHSTNIVVTAGVGGGTRTLAWLKEKNDLSDPIFAKQVFQKIDEILDQLARLKNNDENKFWEAINRRFRIQNGFDRKKTTEDQPKWAKFYEGVFQETEKGPTIEEFIFKQLLNGETRDLIKIPEGIVYYATLIAAGVPETSIFIGAQATTSSEQIGEGASIIFHHNLDPSSIVLSHQPFAQRRVKATFDRQAPLWLKNRARLISHALYKYPLQQIHGNQLWEMVQLAIDEIDRIQQQPLKGIMNPVEIPTNVLEAYGKLKDLQKRSGKRMTIYNPQIRLPGLERDTTRMTESAI